MASRYCSLCEIRYPERREFYRCPVHNTLTNYRVSGPSELWDWHATLLMKELEEPSVKAIDLQPAPLRSGLYYLDVDAVSRTGTRLAVDDVFMVVPDSTADPDGPCDCYWEVIGRYEPGRQWIVKPLRVPDTP